MEDTIGIAVEKGFGPAAVAAARCADYDLENVRRAMREALAPLGGMGTFVRPGERIALKPNLLMGTEPERAVTTHPVVVAAVALEVQEAGAHPVVVESPGTGVVHIASVIDRLYRKAGYREMADRHGFAISLDMRWQTVSYPEAGLAKRLDVMTPILEADGVINLPKLKTHMFMTLTAATKNLFGVVPGINKAAYHAKLNDPGLFAEMLLDVALFVGPRLNVVDAIVGMEGDGPGTGGTPRPVGVLLAGADPVVVDVACCRVAGIDPAVVPVLEAARGRGLWSGHPADVETLGVPVAQVAVKPFALPGAYHGMGVGRYPALDRPLQWGLRRANRRPRPRVGRCTVCGACERACPVKAIVIDEQARVAKVDDELCIRCFCCHEVCPEAAIDLEYGLMGRVMQRLGLVR